MRTRLLFMGMFLFFFLSSLTAQAADPLASYQKSALDAILHNHTQTTGFTSGVGFISKDGSLQYLNGGNLAPNGLIRIGSQTKTFAGSVILKMVDKGYLSLNDTIGSLVAKYKINLGPNGLPLDSGNLTVTQMMNMSSHIPNYLGAIRAGQTQPLWNEWIAANYGTVPGVTHTDLASLGLSGYPQSFDPGATGSYSNTNIVILSLIAEAAYQQQTGTAKNFAEILNEYVINPTQLSHTTLAMTPTVPNITTGYESGKPIVDMDTSIPWTSGAIVSTIHDQLVWLRELVNNSGSLLSPSTFAARTDPANISRFLMGGLMPLDYGLNIFSLVAPTGEGPVTLTGHGGSIAGFSSFSAWHNLADIGIVVNSATLSAMDQHGNFTNIPSETLLLDVVKHLDLTRRGTEITAANLTAATELAPTATGGRILLAPATLGSNLTVQASGRNFLHLDLNNPATVVNTLDPTLLFYSSAGETGLTTTGKITIAPLARMEAYGADNTLLQLSGANAQLNLSGELGAYGNSATAVTVENGANITTTPGSLLYVQGGGGTALHVRGSGGIADIGGTVSSLGASTALTVADSRTVTLQENSFIQALAPGFSMDSSFNTVGPNAHAAYGVSLSENAVLNSQGIIEATALHPWNGDPISSGIYIPSPQNMPGVLTAGVTMSGNSALSQNRGSIHGDTAGIVLASGGTQTVTLSNTNVSGGYSGKLLYSILAADRTSVAKITTDNTTLQGNIRMSGARGNSLSLTASHLVLDLSDGRVGIAGATSLNFGSKVSITPLFSDKPILTDFSQAFTTGVTSVTGQLPTIVSPAKAVQIAVVPNGSNLNIQGIRNWSYYQNSAPNASLGRMLDSMPARFSETGSGLSASGTWLLQRLEMSDTPGDDAAQLQPKNLSDITLSQLRQAGSIRRFLQNTGPDCRETAHKITSTNAANEPLFSTPDGNAAAEECSSRWFAFGGGYGHFGSQEASGQYPDGHDLEGVGFTAGVGRRIDENWRAGFFAGQGQEFQRYDNGGRQEDTITRAGIFAERKGGIIDAFGSLSLGFHDVELNRNVHFASEKLGADYQGMDILASLSLWHDFSLEPFRITPLLETSFISNHTEGYTEKSGSAALKVNSADYTYLASSAGVDMGYDIAMETGKLSFSLGAAWWHQWLDQPDLHASLSSDQGLGFSTVGAAKDNDLLRLRAGARFTTPQSLFLNLEVEQYQGRHMHDTSVVSLSLGFGF